MSERMFPFITATWNPLAGECLHKCRYCWVNQLKTKFPAVKRKYSGEPRLVKKEITNAKGGKYAYWNMDDFVFVCDCTDLFGHWVPDELIMQVLEAIKYRTNRFLLLTKNPQRYLQLIEKGVEIPQNCVLGCTVESDRTYLLSGQPEIKRLEAMAELSAMGYPVMLSIEPIMAFNPVTFPLWIARVAPKFVAVGYDNYKHDLLEPTQAEAFELANTLEKAGIRVYRKTFRPSNREDCFGLRFGGYNHCIGCSLQEKCKNKTGDVRL
jgi:DNA repair photolyase